MQDQPSNPGFTRVTFRKGVLDVRDPEEFHSGKICGQAAMTDGQYVRTDEDLFRFFEDGVEDMGLTKTWNVGFFLGMADALLNGRKEIPAEMFRDSRPPKRSRNRKKR